MPTPSPSSPSRADVRRVTPVLIGFVILEKNGSEIMYQSRAIAFARPAE